MEEERKLDVNEKPLVVQLNWQSDNREGRFVLKKDKDSVEVTHKPIMHKNQNPNYNIMYYLANVLHVYVSNNKGKVPGERERRTDTTL